MKNIITTPWHICNYPVTGQGQNPLRAPATQLASSPHRPLLSSQQPSGSPHPSPQPPAAAPELPKPSLHRSTPPRVTLSCSRCHLPRGINIRPLWKMQACNFQASSRFRWLEPRPPSGLYRVARCSDKFLGEDIPLFHAVHFDVYSFKTVLIFRLLIVGGPRRLRLKCTILFCQLQHSTNSFYLQKEVSYNDWLWSFFMVIFELCCFLCTLVHSCTCVKKKRKRKKKGK